ncbi:hypothetical protein ABKV19_012402 [Rosa sericea]
MVSLYLSLLNNDPRVNRHVMGFEPEQIVIRFRYPGLQRKPRNHLLCEAKLSNKLQSVISGKPFLFWIGL